MTAPGGVRFSHGDHRGEACATCHSSRVQHGQLLIKSLADCQRCHHSGPRRVQCASCHDVAALEQATLETRQTLHLNAAQAVVTRDLPFPHRAHERVACVQCHTNPVSRAPDGAQCASCHASHHTAAADCGECHRAADPIRFPSPSKMT